VAEGTPDPADHDRASGGEQGGTAAAQRGLQTGSPAGAAGVGESVTPPSLETYPIHLGLGASAEPQPAFPRDERAMQWYADYGARHAADGAEGRLVSCYRFTEDWAGWEMHPAGAEVVICIEGSMVLLQEDARGEVVQTRLEAGQYAINPPGVWHTADVEGEARAVFITAGEGTQHRPR